MALYLTEEDVARLLSMKDCIDVAEAVFRSEADGHAENRPRSRIQLPDGMFHLMAGAFIEQAAYGFKAYTTMPGGTRFIVLLYDSSTGQLLAFLEAGTLGQIRTGAATGVATKYLARQDASVVGIIGTGYQARTQLEAVCTVRKVTQVRAFSRSPKRRLAFAKEMSGKLGVEVVSVESGEECVRGAHIVVTVTNAREPVLLGQWLEDGAHVNAAGTNHWMRREIDGKAVARADPIVVDNLEQAKIECGDLIWPSEQGLFRWQQAHELKEVVAGRVKRPKANSITLFESQGLAIEDIAVAMFLYKRAREAGLGQELPF